MKAWKPGHRSRTPFTVLLRPGLSSLSIRARDWSADGCASGGFQYSGLTRLSALRRLANVDSNGVRGNGPGGNLPPLTRKG